MAVIARNNPVGVDFKIDKLQTYIYNKLVTNGTWMDYECYARANKNSRGDNIIPEVSEDPSNYREVLFSDKFNATSFIVTDDNVDFTFQDEGLVVHPFGLIFQVKLDKIYTTVTGHRADEELHVELTKTLTQMPTGIVNDWFGYVIGVDNVYSDLSIGDFGGGDEAFDDLSEYHIVRYNGQFVYNFDECNF